MTDTRRENLLKVRNYLAANTPPPSFGMRTYATVEGSPTVFAGAHTECGTVACVVGHGPLAGIKPHAHESWDSYASRCFPRTASEFIWLFASEWARVDNTVEGAIKRIDYYLEHGVPPDFNPYETKHWHKFC